MIERIRGILVQKTPTFVVVECAGVGYGINISAYTAGKLPDEGAEVVLHTNLVVREDSLTLFGFADSTEKDLFLMLLSVNGVGPKMAQRILSGVTPSDLLNMIASENKAALSKIKGLGKKTAELLIVSLKDHVADDITLLAMDDGPAGSSIVGEDVADAIAALESLGIAKTEAVKRATEAAKHVSGAAEIIAYSLRQQ